MHVFKKGKTKPLVIFEQWVQKEKQNSEFARHCFFYFCNIDWKCIARV